MIRRLRIEEPVIWDHHRGGWRQAVSWIYRHLHTKNGTLFIPVVDEFIASGRVLREPWCGFIHGVPRSPYEFPDLERLLDLDIFKASMGYCRGLWTLSGYLQDYLVGCALPFPVGKIPLAVDTQVPHFDFQSFKAMPRKRLLLVGDHMRRYNSFYELAAPGYEKIILRCFPELDRQKDLPNDRGVTIINRIADTTYDSWLSSSIVYLDLINSSANTVISECIVRATPVLVNRVGAVEEYLGPIYPFYHECSAEAERKLQDPELIASAVVHLQLRQKALDLSLGTFVRNIENHPIYRSLPIPLTRGGVLQAMIPSVKKSDAPYPRTEETPRTPYVTESANSKDLASPSGFSAILVCMPFYEIHRPSIQIGLLAAIGRRHGFSVETLHLNLDLAIRMGLDLYQRICGFPNPEIGNWLFALEAFAEDAIDREGVLAAHPDFVEFLSCRNLGADQLRRLRSEAVPAYLQHAEAAVDWSKYKVVGFTSTFQQNLASFALARRLKQRFPHLITLFGGANFDGEMGRELVRACPWIDYAVQGEADEAFPAFLAAIADQHSPLGIPGILSREGAFVERARPFADLESLPNPDYSEFFERAESLGVYARGDRSHMLLPFEGSRGCWWGEKQHCTFCGLNDTAMSFRQKSSGRVLAELSELAQRYGCFRFTAVDNIMPQKFIREFVPALIAEERQYDLFFEIKANLSRAQIKTLHDAGIRSLQPGIESLHSQVLRLMGKGARASQNVNLLRWATYYGVEVAWNLLWGFPGETEEYYREQAALISHLVHLQPPVHAGRICLERFSPYVLDHHRFPTKYLKPESSLPYIYPPHIDLTKIAYMFEHEFVDELPTEAYKPVKNAVDKWKTAWAQGNRPSLTYRWSPGRLQVEDRREACPRLYGFDSPLAEIYKTLSERPLTAALVKEKLGLAANVDEIEEALDLLESNGLIMRDEELFLALAIPVQHPI